MPPLICRRHAIAAAAAAFIADATDTLPLPLYAAALMPLLMMILFSDAALSFFFR